jgi:CheY-like chemotaxis protein
MKILVVDDERAIRFSLCELLESDGHEVLEDVAIAAEPADR